MIPETKHLCECGRQAVARLGDDKPWRCATCLVKDAHDRGISDLLLAPFDDDRADNQVDVLAPLVDVVAIQTCSN